MTTEELIAARRAEPWREALRKSKKNKERADIPRVKMNELDPEYRSRTRLEEVNLGLTKEQAMQEAERCLDCPNPTCMQGCPVNINIPTFIKNIERGEFLEAAKTLKETSALPAVCGRVCPQEKQCESKCIHLKMGKEAVAIGYLERFAADYERESGNISVPEIAEKNGIKIAVVGSGPAGYTAAIYAARANLSPVLYEGLQPGGQLTTTTDIENFPGYPEGISGTQMMEDLRKQAERFGADLRFGVATAADLSKSPYKITIDEEKVIEAQTVIIATGAAAKYLGLEDEKKYAGMGVSACATCDGFFYRKKVVAVVGGGDTACEEASYLAGLASKVYLIVRKPFLRASKIMQKRVMENEKIEVLFEHNAVGLYGDNGVEGVHLVKRMGEADEQRYDLAIDGFFLAIGHKPNSDIFKPYVDTDETGYILTEPGTPRTKVPGVFAAGDVADPHYRQAITAAATGCMAAIEAERFLLN